MITDRIPRKQARRLDFNRSDGMHGLPFPEDDGLRELAGAIEDALELEDLGVVNTTCATFAEAVAALHATPPPKLTVLAARPLKVHDDGGSTELFGDYEPRTCEIRVWMRTAVRKNVTSYGTFLSTLCHEICHHLDYRRFGFGDSYHTRGFFDRAAVLYHHARGTPRKRLFWRKMKNGQYRIDWPRTNRRR